MSYRSDVNIVFYTRKPDIIPFAALKLWFDENYPREQAKSWSAEIETGDDYVLVKYRDVKWYDGYEHVGVVNAVVDKFTETFEANVHDDVAYEYIRIGEETNDIETDTSTWSDFRMYVRREICFE